MIYYKDYDFEELRNISYRDDCVYVKKVSEDKIELYSNLIFTFDCETTSYFITPENKIIPFDKTKDNDFYINCKKQGMMYIWLIGIQNQVLYGRTYKELKDFFNILYSTMSKDICPIFYVHNLSFDFMFLQNALGTQAEVFSREKHKVMKAYFPDMNVEFRCSLHLTNKKLETITKEFNLSVKKQVGLLDYNVIRTPYTKLTEDELKYCEFDILVMYEMLKQFKTRFQNIYNIPLTQTGIVRNQVKRLFYKDKKHHDLISRIQPNTHEYIMLNEIYMGGYTHANYTKSSRILRNVYSYDITSSYPYVMCVKKYPITKFTKVNPNKTIDTKNYSFIVDFTAEGIESKTNNSFLSISKAHGDIVGLVADNGRVKKAERVRYILTDCDYQIFMRNYNIRSIKRNSLWIARKDYLPKVYIEFILKLFEEKTKYKDVEGMESKYREAKEMLNSLYGMMVTKIIADEIEYKNGEWTEIKLTESIMTEKLNQLAEKKGQNLSFQFGVWVSAYARQHLWDLIEKIGNDVIYCDTDSIKFLNKDNIKYFEEDNVQVEKEINKVCQELFIPTYSFKPLNPNGKQSKLGYFDCESKKEGMPTYCQFRTLGAKKYAYSYFNDKKEWLNYILDKNNKYVNYIEITVSGINKITGAKSLQSLEQFTQGRFFDYDDAGKMECYYISNQEEVTFEDGWIEKSKYGICLKPTTYLLGITIDYEALIYGHVMTVNIGGEVDKGGIIYV